MALIDPANRERAGLMCTDILPLLRRALEEQRFVLFFQPVVNIRTGKTVFHEVLLRLRDTGGNLILPGKFIPPAERAGLMPQIDRWVVTTCLTVLREYRDIRLFVNLSGASLGHEDLLEYIVESITQAGVDPSRISFEVTESSAVRDLTMAERWIRRLKGLGCQFCLDDFGTGFSSFSYLRVLPVDFIKIDGSFVLGLDADPNNAALTRAINVAAHTLGKHTIAEAVETNSVYRMVRAIGVDYAQGYYLGEPSPAPNTG